MYKEEASTSRGNVLATQKGVLPIGNQVKVRCSLNTLLNSTMISKGSAANPLRRRSSWSGTRMNNGLVRIQQLQGLAMPAGQSWPDQRGLRESLGAQLEALTADHHHAVVGVNQPAPAIWLTMPMLTSS
jgi:hypothetical protein